MVWALTKLGYYVTDDQEIHIHYKGLTVGQLLLFICLCTFECVGATHEAKGGDRSALTEREAMRAVTYNTLQ